MEYYGTLLTIVGIHVILALSEYIVLSTGQLSIGQGGFFAIGAYVSGICTVLWNFSLFPALLFGTIAAGILGFFVGFPILRLKGIYLAIVTLAFGQLVAAFFMNLEYGYMQGGEWIGPEGPIGFRNINYVWTHGITKLQFLSWIYIVLGLIVIFFYLLDKSRLGKSFEAVKQDDIKARLMGIDVTRIKVTSFTIGALLAGIGGGFFSHYMSYIEPAGFGFIFSTYALVYVIVGGTGIFWGPIIGAAFLTVLPELLHFMKDYRMMLYGLLILAMVIFRPQGIVDRKMLGVLGNFVRFRG